MNHWFKPFIATLGLVSANLMAIADDPCCPEPFLGYAYNPPLDFSDDCCGWSVNLEYLYWKADERYNVAAVTSFNSGASTQNTHIERLKFDWNSGWRVGIDYRRPCDAWTVSLIWTHFMTNKHAELELAGYYPVPMAEKSLFSPMKATKVPSARIGTVVDPLNSFVEVGNGLTQMFNEANIQFNDVSLVLDREFYVGRALTLTPFTGIKAVFVTSRYDFEFFNLSEDIRSYEYYYEGGIDKIQNDFAYFNKYTGVGVTTGLKTDWDLFCDLGIEGLTSFSLLFGSTDVNIRAYLPSSDEFFTENINNTHLSYNFQEVNFMIDVGIYLRWVRQVYNNQGLFTARIGWEAHYLSDQNRLFVDSGLGAVPFQSGDIKSSPLTFQGLVLGISFSI